MSKQQVIKKEKLTREQKGRLLYEAGKVFELDENKNLYIVLSQKTNDKDYKVNFNMQTCECDDYKNRLEACKHWFAVRDYKTVQIQNIMSGIQIKALSKIVGIVASANESMIEKDNKKKYKIGVIQ